MSLFRKRPGPEKRNQYRISTSDGTPLTILVEVPGGRVSGRVLNVSASGCLCRLEAKHAQGLAVGASLELRFQLADGGRAVATGATIQRVSSTEGDADLALQFTDVGELHVQLDANLWSFFNRRQSFRVRPLMEDGRSCTAWLRWGRERHELAVHDISAMGLAVNLRKRVEPPRSGEESVYARLSLPRFEKPVSTVLGRVHATPMGVVRRVGFRFLPDAPDAERLLEQLTRYVLETQRKLLQPGE